MNHKFVEIQQYAAMEIVLFVVGFKHYHWLHIYHICSTNFLAQCVSIAGSTVYLSPSNINWTYLILTSIIHLPWCVFLIVSISSTSFINFILGSGTGLKSGFLYVEYYNINFNFFEVYRLSKSIKNFFIKSKNLEF